MPRPSRQSLALPLLLGGLAVAVACEPAPQTAASPTPSDDFAVVRSTAEAAYQSGQQHLANGELEEALVSFDRAKVNDPDGRADIDQGLNETIRRLREQPAPTAQLATPLPPPTNAAVPVARLVPSTATPAPVPPTPPTTTPQPAAPPSQASFVTWLDPQGRFQVQAPDTWHVQTAPSALFGQGVVGFSDPTDQATLSVAVDSSAPVVSPELYTARMEIALRQNTPGLALEGVQPGAVSNNPALRRNFTSSQRDGSGRPQEQRGFQVVVVNGTTPYIVTASAPSARYGDFQSILERMVGTFAFP